MQCQSQCFVLNVCNSFKYKCGCQFRMTTGMEVMGARKICEQQRLRAESRTTSSRQRRRLRGGGNQSRTRDNQPCPLYHFRRAAAAVAAASRRESLLRGSSLPCPHKQNQSLDEISQIIFAAKHSDAGIIFYFTYIYIYIGAFIVFLEVVFHVQYWWKIVQSSG